MRWTIRMIAATLLLVGITLGAPSFWLQTRHGHRTLERVLTRLLSQHVDSHVTVGRLSGNLVYGLRAENVVVRGPSGQLIGRADWMAVRWRPLALLRRREIDELTAFHPEVILDRTAWKSQPPGPPSAETIVRQIVAHNGRLHWKGKALERMTGTATLHTNAGLDVHALSAWRSATRLTAYGSVGWGDARPRVAARFSIRSSDQLRGTGEVSYAPGQLEGQIDQLTLAAPLATKLVGGHGPLDLEAGVEGPPGHLRAAAKARQGRRVLRLRALVFEHGHKISVDGRLAGAPRPIGLRARASYDAGTLVVPTLRATIGDSLLDGSGHLRGGLVRARATVRLAPAEARWFALATQAPLHAWVSAEGPTGALRLRARASLAESRVHVRAHLDAPARRARAEVVVRDLQPTQLVAGAPPLIASVVLRLEGRYTQRALVASVHLAHGRLTVAGRTFDRIHGAGDVRLAHSGQAIIRRLAAQLVHRPRRPWLAARGALRWNRDRIALRGATVFYAGSRFAGEATYLRPRAAGAPRLGLRIHAMTLSPELVADVLRYRPRSSWVGHAHLDGRLDDLALQAAAATDLGPAALHVRLQRNGGGAHLWVDDLHLGESRMRGAAQLDRGRVTASVDELMLSPALVHRALPALDPVWPIRLRLIADGPTSAIDLALGFDAGPSTAELRGRVALGSRRFSLSGHLDRFDVMVLKRSETHAQGTLEFVAEGRLTGGGVVGTLNVRRARGFMMKSPFYRGYVDARFDGRAFEVTQAKVEIPGAKIAGGGGGKYGHDFRIGYGVVITDAFALRNVPAPLRLVIGLNGILPGRSVEGSIQKRHGEKIEIVHRVLPIGISQLVFLFRILTGGVPSFHEL